MRATTTCAAIREGGLRIEPAQVAIGGHEKRSDIIWCYIIFVSVPTVHSQPSRSQHFVILWGSIYRRIHRNIGLEKKILTNKKTLWFVQRNVVIIHLAHKGKGVRMNWYLLVTRMCIALYQKVHCNLSHKSHNTFWFKFSSPMLVHNRITPGNNYGHSKEAGRHLRWCNVSHQCWCKILDTWVGAKC